MRKQLDKEASKRIILNCAREIDLLVTRPKNEEAAYHHANFLLIQVALSLLAYTGDEDIHEAVDTVIAGHGIIADRIDACPYIYATESAYNEPDKIDRWENQKAQFIARIEQERAKLLEESARAEDDEDEDRAENEHPHTTDKP